MIINPESFKELESRLQNFRQEKTQLEKKIQSTPRINKGALSFGYYQLSRKKEQIQNKILKINSILHPDIIA